MFSPGLFIRVQIPVGEPYQALLVADEAIQTDQNLKFVYVVNSNNRIVRHDVTLGTQHEGLTVISKGVTIGDRVVINGLQHVRQGIPVRPTLVPMPIPSPTRQSGIQCVPAAAPAAQHPKP